MVHGPLHAAADLQAGARAQQLREEGLRRTHSVQRRGALGQLRRYGRRQRAARAVRVAGAASARLRISGYIKY